MHHIGKFIEFAYPDQVEKYSDVQLDMLYFVMDTVDIQRFTSSESFREFLIRYFLVRYIVRRMFIIITKWGSGCICCLKSIKTSN